MEKTFVNHGSLYITELTKERNCKTAVNMEKASLRIQVSINVKRFTQQNLLDVINVGKCSPRNLTSFYTRNVMWVRSPMNAINVGKPSL